jgi:hypothetical protein
MLIGNYTLGFQHDTVRLNGAPYLERWFVYIFGCTLRLHKFYRGDDDRAPHDHPWAFWTFPLSGYWERVHKSPPCRICHSTAGVCTWNHKGSNATQEHYVKPWRLHYRPSSYQHMVIGNQRGYIGSPENAIFGTAKPFWTIVVTGRKDRSWGFYPDGKYVYWKDFK